MDECESVSRVLGPPLDSNMAHFLMHQGCAVLPVQQYNAAVAAVSPVAEKRPLNVWHGNLCSQDEIKAIWGPFHVLPALLSDSLVQFGWHEKCLILKKAFHAALQKKAVPAKCKDTSNAEGMTAEGFRYLMRMYPCIEMAKIQGLFSFLNCQRSSSVGEVEFVSGMLAASPDAPHVFTRNIADISSVTTTESTTGISPITLIRLQMIFLEADNDRDGLLNIKETSELLYRVLTLLAYEKRTGHSEHNPVTNAANTSALLGPTFWSVVRHTLPLGTAPNRAGNDRIGKQRQHCRVPREDKNVGIRDLIGKFFWTNIKKIKAAAERSISQQAEEECLTTDQQENVGPSYHRVQQQKKRQGGGARIDARQHNSRDNRSRTNSFHPHHKDVGDIMSTRKISLSNEDGQLLTAKDSTDPLENQQPSLATSFGSTSTNNLSRPSTRMDHVETLPNQQDHVAGRLFAEPQFRPRDQRLPLLPVRKQSTVSSGNHTSDGTHIAQHNKNNNDDDDDIKNHQHQSYHRPSSNVSPLTRTSQNTQKHLIDEDSDPPQLIYNNPLCTSSETSVVIRGFAATECSSAIQFRPSPHHQKRNRTASSRRQQGQLTSDMSSASSIARRIKELLPKTIPNIFSRTCSAPAELSEMFNFQPASSTLLCGAPDKILPTDESEFRIDDKAFNVTISNVTSRELTENEVSTRHHTEEDHYTVVPEDDVIPTSSIAYTDDSQRLSSINSHSTTMLERSGEDHQLDPSGMYVPSLPQYRAKLLPQQHHTVSTYCKNNQEESHVLDNNDRGFPRQQCRTFRNELTHSASPASIVHRRRRVNTFRTRVSSGTVHVSSGSKPMGIVPHTPKNTVRAVEDSDGMQRRQLKTASRGSQIPMATGYKRSSFQVSRAQEHPVAKSLLERPCKPAASGKHFDYILGSQNSEEEEGWNPGQNSPIPAICDTNRRCTFSALTGSTSDSAQLPDYFIGEQSRHGQQVEQNMYLPNNNNNRWSRWTTPSQSISPNNTRYDSYEEIASGDYRSPVPPQLGAISPDTLIHWRKNLCDQIAAQIVKDYALPLNKSGCKEGLCFARFVQAIKNNDIPGSHLLFRTREDMCSVVKRATSSTSDQQITAETAVPSTLTASSSVTSATAVRVVDRMLLGQKQRTTDGEAMVDKSGLVCSAAGENHIITEETGQRRQASSSRKMFSVKDRVNHSSELYHQKEYTDESLLPTQQQKIEEEKAPEQRNVDPVTSPNCNVHLFETKLATSAPRDSPKRRAIKIVSSVVQEPNSKTPPTARQEKQDQQDNSSNNNSHHHHHHHHRHRQTTVTSCSTYQLPPISLDPGSVMHSYSDDSLSSSPPDVPPPFTAQYSDLSDSSTPKLKHHHCSHNEAAATSVKCLNFPARRGEIVTTVDSFSRAPIWAEECNNHQLTSTLNRELQRPAKQSRVKCPPNPDLTPAPCHAAAAYQQETVNMISQRPCPAQSLTGVGKIAAECSESNTKPRDGIEYLEKTVFPKMSHSNLTENTSPLQFERGRQLSLSATAAEQTATTYNKHSSLTSVRRRETKGSTRRCHSAFPRPMLPIELNVQNLRLARTVLSVIDTLKIDGWKGPSHYAVPTKPDAGRARLEASRQHLSYDLLLSMCDAVAGILRQQPLIAQVDGPAHIILEPLSKSNVMRYPYDHSAEYEIHPSLQPFCQGSEYETANVPHNLSSGSQSVNTWPLLHKLILLGGISGCAAVEETLEVIALTFAIKLCYPRSFILLRGVTFGVEAECCSRFGDAPGKELCRRLFDVMEFLPVCAVIENTTDGPSSTECSSPQLPLATKHVHKVICVPGAAPSCPQTVHFNSIRARTARHPIPSLLLGLSCAKQFLPNVVMTPHRRPSHTWGPPDDAMLYSTPCGATGYKRTSINEDDDEDDTAVFMSCLYSNSAATVATNHALSVPRMRPSARRREHPFMDPLLEDRCLGGINNVETVIGGIYPESQDALGFRHAVAPGDNLEETGREFVDWCRELVWSKAKMLDFNRRTRDDEFEEKESIRPHTISGSTGINCSQDDENNVRATAAPVHHSSSYRRAVDDRLVFPEHFLQKPRFTASGRLRFLKEIGCDCLIRSETCICVESRQDFNLLGVEEEDVSVNLEKDENDVTGALCSAVDIRNVVFPKNSCLLVAMTLRPK